MKSDNRRIIDGDCDLTLMNARIKEKKARLKEARRPRNESEYVALSKQMIAWFEKNPNVRNFLAFSYRHGYTWSEFKSWRRESITFNQAIETCMQICLERREEYLEKENKLAQTYLREQPVYNPLLSDYEKELKEKGEEASELERQRHEEIVQRLSERKKESL